MEACPTSQPDLPQCARTVVWWAGDYGASFAPVEHGALPLSSFGDNIKHPAHGLIGALVVGPQGTRVCTNDRFALGPDGLQLKHRSHLSAEICTADGQPHHVEHVLVMQDGVSASMGGMPVANLSGAEEPDDYGVKAINYKTDPLWGRRGGDASAGFSERNEQDYSEVLSSAPGLVTGTCAAGVQALPGRPGKLPCDPETPVFEARAGETLRLHFVHPGGHTRQQGLAVAGHAWDPLRATQPGPNGQALPPSSNREGVFNGFGPMMGVTLEMTAGGPCRVPSDYLIRSQASFLFDGGLWGILRVQPGQAGPLPPQCLGEVSLLQR